MAPSAAVGFGDQFKKDHLSIATDRALLEGNSSERLVAIAVVIGRFAGGGLGLGHAEQLAAARQLLLAIAIAQEAVVADALEAIGQNMEQEAADEFLGGEGHRPPASPRRIVLPAEANLPSSMARRRLLEMAMRWV